MATQYHNPSVSAVQKELEVKLSSFPKGSDDLNWICSAIYDQYLQAKKYMIVMTPACQAGLETLQAVVDSFAVSAYNSIMDASSHINKTSEQVLKQPPGATINTSVIQFANKLSDACVDFLAMLPEDVYILMEQTTGEFTTPASSLEIPQRMYNKVINQALDLKTEALSAAIGPLYTEVVVPYNEYIQMLDTAEVQKYLTRMRMLENCMRKPGICDRPAVDFIEPVSRTVWSKYYEEQLMLDREGKIRMDMLVPGDDETSKKKRAQINALFKRIDDFKTNLF